MKSAITFVLLLILCAVTLSSTPQTSRTWEYKLEYRMNEKKANELGAQGWELAGMASLGNIQEYVFKRPKN